MNINSLIANLAMRHGIYLKKGEAGRIASNVGHTRKEKDLLEAIQKFTKNNPKAETQDVNKATHALNVSIVNSRQKKLRKLIHEYFASIGIEGEYHDILLTISNQWQSEQTATMQDVTELVAPYLEAMREKDERNKLTFSFQEKAKKLGLLEFIKQLKDEEITIFKEDQDLAIRQLMERNHEVILKKLTLKRQTRDTMQDLALHDPTKGLEVIAGLMENGFSKNAKLVFQALEFSTEETERLVRLLDDQNKFLKEQLKEERQQANLVKSQERAWKSTLLNVVQLREFLVATPAEITRWIKEGKIPVAERKEFKKWGKHLSTTLHDPVVLEGLLDSIIHWRGADKIQTTEKRKKTLKDHQWSNAVKREKKSIVRKAYPQSSLDDFDIVETPYSVDIPFVGSIELLAKVNFPQSTPDENGKFSNQEELTTLLRYDIQQRLADVEQQTNIEVTSWHDRIETLIQHYEEDEKKDFKAQIRHQISEQVQAIGEDNTTDSFKLLTRILDRALINTVNLHVKLKQNIDLKRKTGLSDYASLFPEARTLKRKLYFHVGPTNSGKTHTAMQALMSAKNGCYLAPLRLMALEASERMNTNNIPTDMLTGEEHILVKNAQHVSSTIELVNTVKYVEVAVIDEIQMISDKDRGWAWTQAVIGVPADTVIMTGSMDALPFITRIAEMTGDDLEVITFERMTPLTAMSSPIEIEQIANGDAIIAFSRAEVMRLRAILGEKMTVAVVYGALSPEARRSEARRFREGEAKVLIATDAIAMGLNMPIERVIFSALDKFDGKEMRPLTASEIRQIAGRAGRYGISEKGEAGVLKGLNITAVKNALKSQPVQALQSRLFVMPPWRAVELVSESLKIKELSKILSHIAQNLLKNDPLLLPASLETPTMIADAVQKSGLTLKIMHSYLGYPLDKRLDASLGDLKSWSSTHGQNGINHSPVCRVTEVPTTDKELMSCEDLSKRLSAYLWLSLRYPEVYPFNDIAMAERQKVNGFIEKALQKKALAKSCRDCGAKLPNHHRFPICEECHQERWDRN